MKTTHRPIGFLSALTTLIVVVLASCLAAPRAAAQGALTNGLVASGTIPSAGATNVWTVAANLGDRVTVVVAKLSGGVTFTPAITLVGPDGLPQGTASGATAARLDIQADLTGTYTVVVADASGTGTGNYQLALAQEPEPFVVGAGDEGGPLTNGASETGTIGIGDLNQWSLAANAGDRIVLQVAKLSGGTPFSPMIELFDPQGTRVIGSSDALAARVDLQATLTGTYTVLISAQSPAASGTYQLQLAQVPGSFVIPAGDEGGPLPDGVAQTGNITLGDLDLWTFAASPGDHINLQITELSGGVSFNPQIELFGPDGTDKGHASGATTATIDTAIESGGTYTVLVSDATRVGSGSYQLILSRSTIAPAGANVLVNGTLENGSIGTAGVSNFWTFTGSVGDNLIVRGGVISGSLSPYVRLYGPNGALLGASDSGTVAEVATRATNSGTFTAVVSDGSAYHNLTGTYGITLAKTGSPITVSPGDQGGPMTNGFQYTGSIGLGDLGVWSFTAQNGQSLVARVGRLNSGESLTPQIRLYGPDGSFLGSGNDGTVGEVSVHATNSGVFTVVIGDGSAYLAGIGDYALTLAQTGGRIVIAAEQQGGPMTNGVMHTGTIDVGGLDAWSFTAQSGQSLVVRVGDYESGDLLQPWVRLWGPDGSYLGNGNDGTAGEVSVRATNSGVFTVVIGDGSAYLNGSGDYRLTLAKTGSPIVVSPQDEGGPLTNGFVEIGTIDVGDLDVWSFSARAGDALVIRTGKYTAGDTLSPWVRLWGPDGSYLGGGDSGTVGEVSLHATNDGVYTVVIADGSAYIGNSGDYRLTLAKSGDPVVIAPLEEGGPMTNGYMHTGSIAVGTLDVWTFNAQVGDALVVRGGTIDGTLSPWVRLYGPNGATLGAGDSGTVGEVAVTATNSGTFIVVIADGSAYLGNSGDYRLTLAKTGSPVLVAPGDEGGPMTGAGSYTGAIVIGDLDAWTFTRFTGETISLSISNLTSGSSLVPGIRLYAPGGSLVKSVAGSTSGFTVTAPATGEYLVVVGDSSTYLSGAGNYELTDNYLVDALREAAPAISGNTLQVAGAGGTPYATYILLTATNLTTPADLWTPVATNQFDQFGTFISTNPWSGSDVARFFRYRLP